VISRRHEGAGKELLDSQCNQKVPAEFLGGTVFINRRERPFSPRTNSEARSGGWQRRRARFEPREKGGR